jgi:hypothetical protein
MQGYVSQYDIREGLALRCHLSPLEAAAHVIFVLEAAISDLSTDRKNNIIFKLKPSIDSEEKFLTAVAEALVAKAESSGNRKYPSIDRFRRELEHYLRTGGHSAGEDPQRGGYEGKATPVSTNRKGAKAKAVKYKEPLETADQRRVRSDFRASVRREGDGDGVEVLLPLDTHDKVM